MPDQIPEGDADWTALAEALVDAVASQPESTLADEPAEVDHFPDADTTEPPAWLEEATEAGLDAYRAAHPDGWVGLTPAERTRITTAVRAAAPIIRRAAEQERDRLGWQIRHAEAECERLRAQLADARASYHEALASIRRLDRSVEEIRDLLRPAIGTFADESNVDLVRRLVAQLADCTCQAWPPDGPAVDCAVHGAVRALNEANAERDRLRSQHEAMREQIDEDGKRLIALRAQLADARRATLNEAADRIAQTQVRDARESAEWLRERAKGGSDE